MIAGAMARRSPARWVAPLALLAAGAALALVIHSTLSPSPAIRLPDSPTGSRTTPSATTPAPKAKGRTPHFYRVKPGDILSRVAEKTGVPVSRIEQLNPKVDANSLRPGQRLRLVAPAR
jgi:LysM repeat protein